MHSRWIASLVVLLLCGVARWCEAQGLQGDSANDNLIVHTTKATTWVDGPTNVVMLDGPVTIELDRTKLTADRAVIWLTPAKGALLQEQDAEIALVGNAGVDQQGQIQRTGDAIGTTIEAVLVHNAEETRCRLSRDGKSAPRRGHRSA